MLGLEGGKSNIPPEQLRSFFMRLVLIKMNMYETQVIDHGNVKTQSVMKSHGKVSQKCLFSGHNTTDSSVQNIS